MFFLKVLLYKYVNWGKNEQTCLTAFGYAKSATEQEEKTVGTSLRLGLEFIYMLLLQLFEEEKSGYCTKSADVSQCNPM